MNTLVTTANSQTSPEDESKPYILIVDDSKSIQAMLAYALQNKYTIRLANDGHSALQIVSETPQPDLILVDVVMPGISGYEFCQALRSDQATADIPVIFLTSISQAEGEQRGFEVGGNDFISKPVNPLILHNRVAAQLKIKAAEKFMKHQNFYLEGEVCKRALELEAMQNLTIMVMASLAETRDNETGNHLRRTQHYVRILAEQLMNHPRFCNSLSEKTIDLLYTSAPLHDIGKVGIPDSILLKPGRLTESEFDLMKQHTNLGRDSIERAEKQFGSDIPFLGYAKEIAYSHQEKFDGSGYPLGIGGSDIPLSARLMAAADVYDALISKRVYKAGMTHDDAIRIIGDGRGSHFDPDIVDALFAQQVKFRAVAARYADLPN